ncbi:Zinc phosphodiesterase ELAC protein 2 [Hypsibius exemplaris]|uniref:Zinc phosphodiesterase ELAC protein 2 n=1 Tax=Hypsibius exemplaris TaxID=2072580 RepID=A0A1W0X2X2_HYPEX|nr:Zinc phosphodiesterase ELAC protein 2 [Hypsibius exemplaris]
MPLPTIQPFHLLTPATFLRPIIRTAVTGNKDRLQYLLNLMPKEKTVLPRVRRRNEGAVLTSPSQAYLQIIGDGSRGSTCSVMLTTSCTRYLFNCGEGTQRFIHEHKLRLGKVENVFFTSRSWANIGGLAGLSLTMQDMGVPKLSLHGPEGINDIYAMTKRFLQVSGTEIDQVPLSETPFHDHAVTIQSVILNPLPSGNRTESTSRKRSRSASPSRLPADIAVAYIGKIADKPGALLISKCIQFGVPPGPLLAKLKSGEDVKLGNGKTVLARDVCEPHSPGPVFMIVECPTLGHIDSLFASPAVQKHQQSAVSIDDVMEVVVHFTPADVFHSKRYLEWVNLFSPSTHHIVANESNCNPNTVAPYRIQAQLNMLDETIFPLLPGQQPVQASGSRSENPIDASAAPLIATPAKPLMSYYLRPPRRLVAESAIVLNNEEFRNEVLLFEGLIEAVEDYRKNFAAHSFANDLKEPDVTFLGTGSALPSKVRNVSAVLLRINRECSMLFDCGESTAKQMMNFFGPLHVDEEMRRLKSIYLSHAHADHHLGLINLIRTRKECFKLSGDAAEPLIIFLPEPIRSFLEVFSSRFEPIMEDIRIVDCADWCSGLVPGPVAQDILRSLDLQEIQICPVVHCAASFGISVTATAGWKICYSGDTMPCQNLVDIGKNCDLLIHEATMEDGMEEDAKKKRHSTTSQAVEAGRSMKAKFTMLTHFSQRYAKIPLLREGLPTDVGVAFDNMRVRLSELSKIPPMLPALKLMFTDHIGVMEKRSEKLERRREREKTNMPADEEDLIDAGVEEKEFSTTAR